MILSNLSSLVYIASGGASVMIGRKTGVASRLLQKYLQIAVWHCLAHRLELAVHDTVVKVAGINNLKKFMDVILCHVTQAPYQVA